MDACRPWLSKMDASRATAAMAKNLNEFRDSGDADGEAVNWLNYIFVDNTYRQTNMS